MPQFLCETDRDIIEVIKGKQRNGRTNIQAFCHSESTQKAAYHKGQKGKQKSVLKTPYTKQGTIHTAILLTHIFYSPEIFKQPGGDIMPEQSAPCL
jgi:hypothetical protein